MLSPRAGFYIHATENIQEALLAQLNPAPEFRAATGFTFELCGPNERAERCKRLIQELHSIANEGHAKLIPQLEVYSDRRRGLLAVPKG